MVIVNKHYEYWCVTTEKTESWLYERSEPTPAKTPTLVKKLKPCPVVHKPPDQCIHDEMCQSQYAAFVNIVDEVYY